MRKSYYLSTIILSLLTIGLLFTSCNEVTESRTAFHLSTAAEPSEGGSVTPDRDEVDEGESVEITAEANEGWIFKSWQGGHSGSSNPAPITMDQDRQVTALFQKVEFALNKETEGEGNIYERIIPQKTTHHTEGTVVEVVAVPEDGWKFSHWEEALDGSDNPVTLEMDGEKTIRAVFERKDYELTVKVDGEGAVSEDVVQAKTTEYPYETVVELTANAGDGWEFSHWKGDLDGSKNPKQINITESKEVTAVFVRSTFDLNISIEGDGSVSTELLSGNETDDGYEYESEVELTAESEAGSQFARWEGDIEETDNPITVTITEDLNITAVFEDADYNLTIEIQGEGNVEQEVVQGKTTEYEGGTQVKLTATAEGDWRFVGWKEGATGTESEITVTIDRDKTVIASFDNSGFEGGDGSEQYPYEVATVEQLQDIRDYTDRHFVQVNDIDASDTENWNGGDGFKPIGDDIFRFIGSYDGQNHQIVDLFINNTTCCTPLGLFGEIEDATIVDINLINVKIYGTNRVGGITGIGVRSKLENIYVSGKIEASYRVGGILGNGSSVDISSSKVAIDIEAIDRTGGLAGYLSGGFIYRNFTEGVINVSGGSLSNSGAGGLIGQYIGGFGGGKVEESFSSMTITGLKNLGGLIGNLDRGNLINSYASGDVTGDENLGGLVGLNENGSVIANSFSYGVVTGDNEVGVLVGTNAATLENLYCNSDISSELECVGRGTSDGVKELTTTEMLGASAEDNLPEFDWGEIWITISGDYPILRWQEH